MDKLKINTCVESLCLNGCDAVNATIEALENGLPVVQTDGFSEAERQHVLTELKTIMSVYED